MYCKKKMEREKGKPHTMHKGDPNTGSGKLLCLFSENVDQAVGILEDKLQTQVS